VIGHSGTPSWIRTVRSRRISKEHRLVYVVKADSVYFLAARYHHRRS